MTWRRTAQGWLGELEGLRISLATVTEKLQSLDARIARQPAVTNLGMPAFTRSALRLRRPAGQQRRNPVNGRPEPQHPLARSLRACARGIYPDEAAIELLIGQATVRLT